MTNIKYKNLLNWQNIVLVLVFSGSLYGFVNFESSWIIKVIISIFSVGALLYFILKNSHEYFILISYLLAIFDLYNAYFMIGLPLWSVMLLVFSISGGIIYIWQCFNRDKQDDNINLFYTVFFALIAMEIFLSLVPWPADPKNKAMIILGVFYLFTNLVLLRQKNEWELKKILPYLIIILVIIILVITTIKWYGY